MTGVGEVAVAHWAEKQRLGWGVSHYQTLWSPTRYRLCCCVCEPNGIKRMNARGLLVDVTPSCVNTVCVCSVHSAALEVF